MNTTASRTLSALSLLALLSASAHAQDATSSGSPSTTSRAAVKSEARSAEQSGAMPHGDLPIPATTPNNAPADRTTMKKDTAAFTKTKQPVWMPNTGSYQQGNTMKSTADRSTVKANTKDAEKSQSIPRGQAAQPMTSAQ